uniref:Uncharacterized protein n=1 Tax=Caenorhabditis japonica TaxID=281687 RepID=A0A8R1EE16_CAEJA
MAPKPNPPPKEDTWAFQPIGSPFPPSPVKCLASRTCTWLCGTSTESQSMDVRGTTEESSSALSHTRMLS